MAQRSPQSIRLDTEIVEGIDRHIAMRNVLGEKLTRSDVIREALDAYVPALEAELRKKVLKHLSEGS